MEYSVGDHASHLRNILHELYGNPAGLDLSEFNQKSQQTVDLELSKDKAGLTALEDSILSQYGESTKTHRYECDCVGCNPPKPEYPEGPTGEELDKRRADRSYALRLAGIPKRYRMIDFQEPEQWPADQRTDPPMPMTEWKPWKHSTLLITGKVGAGKTTLATQVVYGFLVQTPEARLIYNTSGNRQWWWNQPYRARFVRCHDYVDLCFDRDTKGEAEEIKAFDGLLFVDDLGSGISGGQWAKIESLLAHRYDSILPTIATTNLTLAQINDQVGRVADRLGEGMCVRLAGESRREFERDSKPPLRAVR